MTKLIYLIGLPGTGKTTIMKRVMQMRDWESERPIDLLDTHVSGELRVLGKYEEGQVFAGTDRLSMAVAPKAVEWILTAPNEVIIGEGDRLNNKAFFEAAQSVGELYIIHLTVSDEERQRRYNERGSDQSEKFIQTVRTKVGNIVESFGDKTTIFGEEKGCVYEFRHETPEDTAAVAKFIHQVSVKQ
jgi:adenylate kinase family enzyme